MKLLLPLYLLLALATYQCKGQSKTTGDSNFISFQGKLKEYKIDSCLIDLMWAIVEADSGHVNYPPELFFYQLEMESKEGIKELYVYPSRWLKSSRMDYKGVVHIGDMSFLCRGDFISDPLFSETGNYVDVTLKRPKPYKYDSVDARIEMFVRNPSLIGKYDYCEGGPISLYILVGKKLEGFETKK